MIDTILMLTGVMAIGVIGVSIVVAVVANIDI
jgi:hypothetical protein